LHRRPLTSALAEDSTAEDEEEPEAVGKDETEPESEPEEQDETDPEDDTPEEDDPEPKDDPTDPCYNPDDEDRCIEGPEDEPKEDPEEPEPDPDPTDCDESYPDDCIPSPPPNLNCDDKGVRNNIKVEGSDPHDFDRDNDGIGCEDGGKIGGTGGGGNGGNGNGNGNGGGDDDNDNDKSDSNNKDNDSGKDGNKAEAEPEIKKFQVTVILNETDNAESDTFRMRVIAYGPKTLNKLTLDKPGQVVDMKDCASVCNTEWGFTAYKVSLNTTILACVWNPESGDKNCGLGKSDSRYGPEIISIRVPSLKK